MLKSFKKFSYLLFLGGSLFVSKSYAQSVSITSVDPGPYTPGSTIAARISIAPGSCLSKSNVFSLYLSDETGSFSGAKMLLGINNGYGFNGSYATFINGVIPAGFMPVAGGTYKVRVETSSPASVGPASSATITINAGGTATIAGLKPSILNSTYPEVFGSCTPNSTGTTPYNFTNTSTAGATASASFYDDMNAGPTSTQNFPASNIVSFNADISNYTVFIKAVSTGGTVGTKAFLLTNNNINNNFATTAQGPICLGTTGATAAYAVSLTGPNGLQHNYPGMLYTLSWGDGTTTTYTYCEIVSLNGQFIHNYSHSSCGQSGLSGSTRVNNAYPISFSVNSEFCSGSAQPISTFQAILSPPTNSVTGPTQACTNVPVIYTNASYPGQSQNSASTTCTDANASYTWFVDGAIYQTGVNATSSINVTFTTPGNHTVKLHLDNPASTACAPADYIIPVCVQNAPIAKFTLPLNTYCAPATAVAITDASTIDQNCSTNYTYLYTISPATGFSFAAGTTKNSKSPVIDFTTPAKYVITLQITPPAGLTICPSAPYVDSIFINGPPVAALSPDFSICGNNQTLKFGPATGSTKTILTGSSQTIYSGANTTYKWVVTPPAGGDPAVFISPGTENSMYPSIKFPSFGTYTVTVNQTNSCGATASATQMITFQNAPAVDAGADLTVCAGSPVTVTGVISNNGSLSGAPVWSGGTGTGTITSTIVDAALSTTTSVYTYIPSAADIQQGSITLTLTGNTNLVGSCSTISDNVVVNFHPANTITSIANQVICSGNGINYVPTSTVAGSTYTWTAVASSALSTSIQTSGSGNIVEPVLISNSTLTNATIIYTIIPHANGCDGTPFTYTLSIAPKPVITAAGPTGPLCSGQPSGITLTSNINTVAYTWTATASSTNISGFTNISTAAQVNQIQDVLVNTGSLAATVTYLITPVNSATADNCPGNLQTITITVQPAPVTANAGADESVCGVTSYKLKGNDLGTNGTGLWTLTSGQAGVIFDDASIYNTSVNGLQPGNAYTFRWTSKGASPCNDTFDEVTINDQRSDIRADFTADNTTGCDQVTVNFTNTSTQDAGITYLWDFGNGTTSANANPSGVTYTSQANGKDSVYTVKLTITNACTTDYKTLNITVRPAKPLAAIAPDRTVVCAPYLLTVQNLSPGTNLSYTYYLTDANGTVISKSVKTDKTDQQFQLNTSATYKVYMVAQNECGTATSTNYTILATPNTAKPRLTINGNDGTGCAPLTVTFHNTSTGTTSYRYDWGDGTTSLVSTNANDVTHTFIKGGTYSVVLHGANGCTLDAVSDPVTINVLYQPLPSFTADNTLGCKSLTVQFKNTTADAVSSQLTDLTYDWDFGDGSAHSSEINPLHHYDFKHSPYTVKLIATNRSGCSDVAVSKNLIVVNSSSITDFEVKPDSVISIPNYHFSFTDLTTGNPQTWKWDFGDGGSSTSKNPDHTYADTGLYKVTLTTANAYCDSTKSHYVRIIGVPGQVYLANAFMPNSVTPELRTYSVKGSGLKEWHFQIYNNYGQLIYESSALNERGEPMVQWDGTFNGVPAQQGTYVWQATGKFVNGNEWKGMAYNNSPPKHTGIIYLIR